MKQPLWSDRADSEARGSLEGLVAGRGGSSWGAGALLPCCPRVFSQRWLRAFPEQGAALPVRVRC